MHRFFVDENKIENAQTVIAGSDYEHIARVLRLSAGDEIAVCDGAGSDYTGKILQFQPGGVLVQLSDKVRSESELPFSIALFQCLPKAGKMETIIQKATELGVSRIVPVVSEYCVVKVSSRDFAQKLTRYNRIAYEAAKQSRRGAIPEVCGCVALKDCTFDGIDLVLLADEDEYSTTLHSLLHSCGKPNSIAIIIGPEGGFSREEVETLKGKGARCISLGKRILRTETAGPAMIAMLTYEFEG